MLSTTARLGVAPSARVAPAPRGVSSRSSRPILTIPRASRLVVHAAGPTANDQGMYDGTVFFHLYPELSSPKPIFNTFLEGALHCAEVARSHPAYQTAHFHEAHDQELAIDCKPHGYFNMTLFSCAPENLWSEFEDLHECLDIGHMNQEHHPLPCREIAAFPGPESAVSSAPHGAARCAGPDATVLVAVPAGRGLDPNAWTTWAGVEVARTACEETFLGATLHECVDGEAKYSHVARVELGAASDEAVAAADGGGARGRGRGERRGRLQMRVQHRKDGNARGCVSGGARDAKEGEGERGGEGGGGEGGGRRRRQERDRLSPATETRDRRGRVEHERRRVLNVLNVLNVSPTSHSRRVLSLASSRFRTRVA